MKKIFKYLVLCLFLTSCGFSATNYYYEKIDNNGDLKGQKSTGGTFDFIDTPWINEKFDNVSGRCSPNEYFKIENDYKTKNGYKRYCIYYIGPPITFKTKEEYHAKYIKKAIKELNQEGRKGKAMKNILLGDSYTSYAILIFSSRCIDIVGELIEEEEVEPQPLTQK
jgi:hypothetical protein